jgi:tetratricopeptide (TPR) repeat protein
VRRNRARLLSLAALGGTLLPLAAAAQSADFVAARSLYASAAYEDALARFATITAAEETVQVEQYKALCFVALGRVPEAQQALERMVVANPLYVMRESDVSPRLITMFREVRKRVLPTEVRSRYTKAKTSYDEKRFEAAVQQFKELIAILGDPDVGAESGLPDLKMLGEGFLKLADAEATAAAAAAAKPTPPPDLAVGPPTPPVPPASGTRPAATSTAAPDPIYSADDKDVTPPVDAVRRMPVWDPPLPAMRKMYFRGVLEVVIDETGNVKETRMRQAVSPHYDPALLAAAMQWKFKPAMKDGRPVKYRKLIEIILQPVSD